MRLLFTVFLHLIIFHFHVWGQLPKAGTCDTHYYSNKVRSSEICMDKDGRNGQATIYNKKGEEIVKWYVRTFAGHASAHFKYHANGGVRVAEFSSQPDGGIQRYREKIDLDEDGNIVYRWVDQYPYEPITTFTTEPASYQISLPGSEVVVLNESSKEIHLVITDTLQLNPKIQFYTVRPKEAKSISFLSHRDTTHNPLFAYRIYKVKIANTLEGALQIQPEILRKTFSKERNSLQYIIGVSERPSKKSSVVNK